MKLKKFENNPILSPNPGNEWEELVTCNPGVVYDNGTYYMLYRAAGNDKDHVIRFGLATSTDGFNFKRASDKPVFGPSEDGPDSGCVEDPRIVKFADDFFVTYAYRAYPPGQYWTYEHDVVNVPECSEYMPAAIRKNIGNTGLAVTKDFIHYRRLGRITSPALDDRDVIIFPEKIGGKFTMLHRPKQFVGEEYGTMHPAVWIKFSDDLLAWEDKDSHLLLTGFENTWEEKIGGSTPPILTDAGWLMLYHGVEHGGTGHYRVGAVLLDKENPLDILGRTTEPILEPEEEYELNGYYNGCVFPTGNVIVDNNLLVYYGCADKHIGLATCELSQLLEHLQSPECKAAAMKSKKDVTIKK